MKSAVSTVRQAARIREFFGPVKPRLEMVDRFFEREMEKALPKVQAVGGYVVNSGGLINVNAELAGWTMERAHDKAGEIYDTVYHLLEISRDEGIPSYKAARRLAQRRIEEAKQAVVAK